MKKCKCNICQAGGCCQAYASKLEAEIVRLKANAQNEIEGFEELVKSHKNFCDCCVETVKGRVHCDIQAKEKLLDGEVLTLLTDIIGWDGILDHSKVRITGTIDKIKQ